MYWPEMPKSSSFTSLPLVSSSTLRTTYKKKATKMSPISALCAVFSMLAFLISSSLEPEHAIFKPKEGSQSSYQLMQARLNSKQSQDFFFFLWPTLAHSQHTTNCTEMQWLQGICQSLACFGLFRIFLNYTNRETRIGESEYRYNQGGWRKVKRIYWYIKL